MSDLFIQYEGKDLRPEDIATSLGALGALAAITAQYLEPGAAPNHANHATTGGGYAFDYGLMPALRARVDELLFGGPKTFGLNGGGLFAYVLFLYGQAPERIEEGHASTLIERGGFAFLADRALVPLAENPAARTMVDRFSRILDNGARRIIVTRAGHDEPSLRITPHERPALRQQIPKNIG